MYTLITSKSAEIDENIANQNHAIRTRNSEGAYYKNYANYDTSMKIWEDR
jgi:hypothetical protein